MSADLFKSFEPFFTNNQGGKLLQVLALPNILQNPYPYYDFLHSKGSILWLNDKDWNSSGFYMVSDFSIIEKLLTSKSVGHDFGNANWSEDKQKEMQQFIEANPYMQMSRAWMLNSDPPFHTKIRSLMNNIFTPTRVRDLSESIKSIANSLLEGVSSKDTFDLIREFSYPLPVLVIASLLGVPEKGMAKFKEWTKTIIVILQGVDMSEVLISEVNKVVVEMRNYFRELIRERESNPASDLITALVKENNPDVSIDAIVDNLILLLVAGHETTMNLIGNGTYQLFSHPNQLTLLKDDSKLSSNAVEEILRYDSPVQFAVRRIYADFNFGNNSDIKSGELTYLMLASANRNESSNPNPDVFDITRQNIRHLSFSKGIHYCLGAPLARLEGKIAFETLFEKFPKLELSTTPIYRKNINLRGLQNLMLKH